MDLSILALIGFMLTAYSIVANDAIQTLGTFLASNGKRPWWVLWLFACGILLFVIVYGWYKYSGDVSYARLERIPPPADGIQWYHVVPPVAILILTRFAVPVSTSFLILTVFAPKNLFSMMQKSLLGYVLAFFLALVVYKTVMKVMERFFLETSTEPVPLHWVVIQWCSTAFLWGQWLIQDLANIYVYLPRDLKIAPLAGSLALMMLLIAIIFYRHGGEIQHIVTSKTNTADVRSASIVDFLFGLILYFFKEMSNIPMSTTWVFLGVLAGREIAMVVNLRHRSHKELWGLVAKDALKAFLGLAISVLLAFGLPWLDNYLF